MTSSQSKIITYATKYGKKKITPKQLNLKVSATTDAQLTAAIPAGTYDQTFQQIMQTQLNSYGNDLQKAYKATKGKNGRAILSDSFKQAQLLSVQLAAPAN